ncbi:MAG TPA: hypothetical protein VNG33_05010 [Polyangiaceae bacterium]|nr:hypothetical protein [Polyangiaceae bacterium]
MGKLWWCLVVAIAVASACQADHEGEQAGSSVAAQAGASASNAGTSAGSAGRPLLAVGGTFGEPIQPTGASGAPDLSGVVTPLIRCHADVVGGQNGGGEPAAGGAGQAKVAPPVGGAPFDDVCSPPPSVCLDDLTLVYFDQGECVAGRCEWVKQSLTCRNLCRATGCQDSITTK